jgi:spermidine synthase
MYDMICIDIFIDDHIPHYFLTKEFLMQVQTCLSSEGTILFNHLGHTHDDIEAAKNYFSTVFSVVFPDSQMMRVKKNFMMISHPHTWVIEK